GFGDEVNGDKSQPCRICNGTRRSPGRGDCMDCNLKRTKEYHKSLSGRFAKYKASAKYRGIPWLLTLEQADTLWRGDCFWCGASPEGQGGIDRLDSNLDYIEG